MEIVELGRKPGGEPLAQQPAQLLDAEANRRRHRAHALGEVPHRQPFLEQLGAVGDKELDAACQRCLGLYRTGAVEGAADREVEGGGIELGEAGEVLEQGAGRKARDGAGGARGGLDAAAAGGRAAAAGSTSPAWMSSRVAWMSDCRVRRPRTMRPSCDRET